FVGHAEGALLVFLVVRKPRRSTCNDIIEPKGGEHEKLAFYRNARGCGRFADAERRGRGRRFRMLERDAQGRIRLRRYWVHSITSGCSRYQDFRRQGHVDTAR